MRPARLVLLAIVTASCGRLGFDTTAAETDAGAADASDAERPTTRFRSIGDPDQVFLGAADATPDSRVVAFRQDVPPEVGPGDQIQFSDTTEPLFIAARLSSNQFALEFRPSSARSGQATVTRAYSDLRAWFEDRRGSGDLVSDQRIEVAVVTGDSPLAITASTRLALENAATSAQFYFEVRAGRSHRGVAGEGAIIDGGGGIQQGIINELDHTRFVGLELRDIYEPGSGGSAAIVNRGKNVVLDGLLVYRTVAGEVGALIRDSITTGGDFELRNSILYTSREAIRVTNPDSTAAVNGCSVFDTTADAIRAVPPITITNTIAAGCGGSCIDAPGATQEANISEDDTASGVGSQTGVAALLLFQGVDQTIDLHLADGSPAIGGGTDVGLKTDIDGEARPQGALDIGADEVP